MKPETNAAGSERSSTTAHQDHLAQSPDPASQSPADSAATPPAPEAEQNESAGKYIYVRREHLYALAAVAIFAAGLGVGYLIWGSPQSGEEADSSQAAGRVEISLGDDPRLGPQDAPVTIVEFSDFNCPYCRAWHQQTFPELLNTFPGQIQFVYKDFPVVAGGTVGEGAAQAANCAAEQDAYWEYHSALLSGQFALDRSGFEQAAHQVGISGEALLLCLDSGRQAQEVRDDLRYGAGLGVTGTPTFFINGIPLVGAQPLLRFIEVINAELAGG